MANEIEELRREAILRAITGTAANVNGPTPKQIADKAAQIAEAVIALVPPPTGSRGPR